MVIHENELFIKNFKKHSSKKANSLKNTAKYIDKFPVSIKIMFNYALIPKDYLYKSTKN